MNRFTRCFILLVILIGNFTLAANTPSLLKFPLQWQFNLPQSAIILTSDQQLEDLQDPDKKINVSLGLQSEFKSLRELRDQAAARGCHTVILAFDNFFRQYRNDAGAERNLLPDSDEYIRRIQKISRFLQEKNLGLELSLLSPLELGPAFAASGGEPGRWVHFQTDLRDSVTGQFSVMFWEQLAWSNNKGKFNLKRAGVRAFAYKGKNFASGMYTAVDPNDIIEITSGIQIEEWPGTASPEDHGYRAHRVRVFHPATRDFQGYDRVLVVLSYTSPEMDYFSPDALPFLRRLLDKYKQAGIELNGLYSDEMHIQQDWGYFGHQDNGQFSLRYLTPNLAAEYAKRFGAEFADLDKFMLYFSYGMRPYLNTTRAVVNNQIVFGESPEAIHRTFLFRDRYYKLLTSQVVDLFVVAKQYAEKLWQHDLLSRAHATWAQSPTIDQWQTGGLPHAPAQYEYTPNFIWSNTVQQAASACYDYFKWGEYLTGNGNDHTEGGWSDRNYYGAALGCSFGIINKYPNAYAAHWGMPAEMAERRQAVVDAFGASASPLIQAVTENVHRDVDVLLLYPMNLVATEERFGSWMVQYGYANYITAEKLLEMGQVKSGRIEIAGRNFSTLVTLFEILPPPGLLDLMQHLVETGGRVIWSGPPPLLANDGQVILPDWQNLFGVKMRSSVYWGDPAPGKIIHFENELAGVPDQTILTDFLVDRIYPVEPVGSQPVARVETQVIGALHQSGSGTACFLGFRPRDDQAASLGQEQRNFFEILAALGAYPATGQFAGVNDNTEFLSRTTGYLNTRFPNGVTVVASHYRAQKENWPGGFARDRAKDLKILQENPLPSDRLKLENYRVNGHEVTFDGRLIVAFNVDADGDLTAFAGLDCRQITVDGRTVQFSTGRLPRIAWAPVAANRRVPGGAILQLFFEGTGSVAIPFHRQSRNLKLFAEGKTPGSRGEKIDFLYRDQTLQLTLNAGNTGRWLYLCE